MDKYEVKYVVLPIITHNVVDSEVRYGVFYVSISQGTEHQDFRVPEPLLIVECKSEFFAKQIAHILNLDDKEE